MGKIIFIDFDGTLYDNRARLIYESSIIAMKKSREKGHKIFICSGRSISGLKQYLYLPVDGICCGSGSEVYVGNKLIYSKYFPAKEVKKLIKRLDGSYIGYSLETNNGNYLSPLAWERFIYNHRELSKEAVDLIIKNNDWFKVKNLDIDSLNVCKMCVYFNDLNIFKLLMEQFDLNYVVITKENQRDNIAELTLKNVSKWTAVQKVIKYLSADIKDTIGIGDSENDMELIEGCQLSAAMGNAVDKIKKSADFVTTKINDNGIYNVFKHFKLIDCTCEV
jgi:HAD-superfamily hydrolase, subfamily IIB